MSDPENLPSAGEHRKRAGIEQVLSGVANAHKARAIGLYRRYMSKHPHGFTAEQCHDFAVDHGLEPFHHPNARGGLWNALARSKIIVKTGRYVKARNATNHACEVPVWRITEKF